MCSDVRACVRACVHLQGVLFLDASIHKEEASPHDRMREFLHHEVGPDHCMQLLQELSQFATLHSFLL